MLMAPLLPGRSSQRLAARHPDACSSAPNPGRGAWPPSPSLASSFRQEAAHVRLSLVGELPPGSSIFPFLSLAPTKLQTLPGDSWVPSSLWGTSRECCASLIRLGASPGETACQGILSGQGCGGHSAAPLILTFLVLQPAP